MNYVKDIVWTKKVQAETDFLFSSNTEFGRFTVLDRLTGYGYGERDIESGYKDKSGLFWLSSGDFDIRRFPELTIIEAIDLIKKESNTCIAV